MTRKPPVDADLPWSVPLAVDKIPAEGLHQELSASPGQAEALRAVAGVVAVTGARASFDLRPLGRGRIQVTGRVVATVGQTCVVTLEPLQSVIDEPVDVLCAPEDQIAAIIKAMDEAAEAAGEDSGDPPEPIVDGLIDLGKLAADVLFLGIDPYPRKPDAVFEPPVEPVDPEDHPFAALAALKQDGAAPAKRKKPR